MTNSARVTTCIVFLFALSFSFFALQSGDVLMYLALARDFLLQGEFAPKDPYLYSLPNADLHIAHEYLSYLLYYGAWSLLDVGGLIALKVLVLSVLFAVVLRSQPRSGNQDPVWIVLWCLAVYAASFRFIERSSIFSDFFCVWLVSWLVQEKTLTRRLIVQLSLLFLFWAQLHPGYPLGLLIVGLWAAWQAVFEPEFKRRSLLWLLLPLALMCVNPLGVEGLLYPFRFALNEAAVLKHHNYEWFPSYHAAFRATPEVLAFWCLLVLCTGLLLRARQFSLRTLLALFAALSAIQAVRFVPWASFSLVVLCKPILPEWKGRWRTAALNCLMVAMGVVAIKNFAVGYTGSSGPRTPVATLDHNFFPIKTLEFLRAHPIPGQLYNAHDFGSYLVWQRYTPIFHHGFVTDMVFYENDVAGLFQSQARFLELAKKYGWTKLLVDKHGSYPYFYQILSPLPDWKIVAEDEASYLIYLLPDPK